MQANQRVHSRQFVAAQVAVRVPGIWKVGITE